MSSIVFFDLETTGREPGKHRIIQFAGAAVDSRTLSVLEELDVRVQLTRKDEWEPEALAGNCFAQRTGYKLFDPGSPREPGDAEKEEEVLRFEAFERCATEWNRGALTRDGALDAVNAFLERHRSVQMVSKRNGKGYAVARLAGFNIATFDIPHLRAWYGARFFPAEYRCLDVYQLACWVQWMETGLENVPLNLTALRDRFGIRVPGEAHDALVDVRATVELTRRLLFKLPTFRLPEAV